MLLVSLSRNKTQESTCMKTATVKTPDTPRIFQIVSIPAARRGWAMERDNGGILHRALLAADFKLKILQNRFELLFEAVGRAARETNKMSEPEGGLRLLYGWFGYHPHARRMSRLRRPAHTRRWYPLRVCAARDENRTR